MDRRITLTLTRSENDIGSIANLLHIAEILGSSTRGQLSVHLTFANQRPGRSDGCLSGFWCINHSRITFDIVETYINAMGQFNTSANLLNTFSGQNPGRCSKRAARPADQRIIGQDIPSITRIELGHAKHQSVLRIDIPTDNTLQGTNKSSCSHDRVRSCMRMSRVRTFSSNFDFEKVRCRKHRPSANTEMPQRHLRRIVHAVDRIAWEKVKQPLLHHALGTAFIFFRWLENKAYRPLKVAILAEVLRRAQQHCRMTIMTASMHFPDMLRNMIDLPFFFHIQSIHIRPQTNGRTDTIG